MTRSLRTKMDFLADGIAARGNALVLLVPDGLRHGETFHARSEQAATAGDAEFCHAEKDYQHHPRDAGQ